MGWIAFWSPFAWIWRECPHSCGFILGMVVTSALWLVLILAMFHHYIEATT